MSKKLRSNQLTEGIERAAHRALLHCAGFEKEDFKKPMVAIVNSWNEIVPGHIHLRELADYAKQGVIEAGGIPKEFNTIAVCDGLCQGHKGMSYPLPSREVIADSIELMVDAHQFDAMVMLPGCDKVVPGHIMAALRINIPTVVVTSGPMEPGKYKEFENITLTDMREFIGKAQTGIITMEELSELEKNALPGPGTCAMMGTANTMGCLAEVLGLSLPGCGVTPAVKSVKNIIAKESGKQVIKLLEEDIKPRDIIDEAALKNTIIADMALGGSTNSVLHLISIAKEAGIELELDEFDRIGKYIPHICNVKPAGNYPITYLYEAGGIPGVLKTLEEHLCPEQLTVTGKTIKENLSKVFVENGEIIRTLDNPLRKEGGIAVLKGNLAPNGAVVKQAAVKTSMLYFEGKARVFHSMEDAIDALTNDEIVKGDVIVVRYEGPKGGPGMREMHMITSLIVGRGMDESIALITDGRFSGSTRGPAIGHISPEAAAGGPIAAVQEGDKIIIDIPNRRLEIDIEEKELQERLEKVEYIVKVKSGALAKYASLVTSADKGAVLVPKITFNE